MRRNRVLTVVIAAVVLAAGIVVMRATVPVPLAPPPVAVAQAPAPAPWRAPESAPEPARIALEAPLDPAAVALGPAARRETEGTWLERDLAVERRAAGTLRREAEGILAGAEPDSRKVALLRAVCDADPRHADTVLARALAVSSNTALGHGEGPAAVALRLLCERAATQATARAALRVVAAPAAPAPAAWRRRAVAAISAHGDAAERAWLLGVLRREPAAELLAVAEAAARHDR